MKKLIEEIDEIAEALPSGEVSIGFLLEKLSLVGMPFLFMILAIPFIFPIPIPGLSIVFGLLIFILGIGYLVEKNISLPQRMINKKISSMQVEKILKMTLRLLKKIEPFRINILDRIFKRIFWLEKIMVLLVIVSAFILMLPLPPGTNFPSALTIVVLSVGLLQRNSLILSIGSLIFISKIYLINLFSQSLFETIFRLF